MADAHIGTLEHETRTSMEFVAGGSLAEVIGGVGACILAIVGLSGVIPGYLAAIATIAAGAALLLEGGSILARYSELLQETAGEGRSAAALEGGMSAESLGGLAAVALGILALVGVASMTLLSVALILLGGSLLLGSAANRRLNALHLAGHTGSETVRRITHEAVSAATGAQVLIGIAALVLGVLAVIGVASLTLVLVGLLATGFSVLLSGTALGGRMIAGLRGE